MASTRGVWRFFLTGPYWSGSHLRVDRWGGGRVPWQGIRWGGGGWKCWDRTMSAATKCPHLRFSDHQTWGRGRAGRTGWRTRLHSSSLSPVQYERKGGKVKGPLPLNLKALNGITEKMKRARRRSEKWEWSVVSGGRLPEVSLWGTSCWAPCSWPGSACSSDPYRISYTHARILL